MRGFLNTGLSEAAKQINSVRQALTPVAPDVVDYVSLAADTIYRHPIPQDGSFVQAEFEAQFFMRLGVVADSIPATGATTTNGLAGESRPGARAIPSGATHVILRAPAATTGSLTFWN